MFVLWRDCEVIDASPVSWKSLYAGASLNVVDCDVSWLRASCTNERPVVLVRGPANTILAGILVLCVQPMQYVERRLLAFVRSAYNDLTCACNCKVLCSLARLEEFDVEKVVLCLVSR